eukprot:5582491-Amphidinium_carterae.2
MLNRLAARDEEKNGFNAKKSLYRIVRLDKKFVLLWDGSTISTTGLAMREGLGRVVEMEEGVWLNKWIASLQDL